RILGGFDNFIYGFSLRGAPGHLSGRLILRLYRTDTDPRQACFESTLQNVLAAGGAPSPRVVLVRGAGGGVAQAAGGRARGPGRLRGDTLRGPAAIRMATTLACAQLALHAVDPEPVRRALANVGWSSEALGVERELEGLEREIERAHLDGLRPGARWLAANRPRPSGRTVICHGDFHPLNVLVDRGRLSGVIDWSERRLRSAERAYDVGATLALLSHGPYDAPAVLAGPIALGRRLFITAYRRCYARERPLDRDLVGYHEALRCLGFLVEAGTARQA